MWSRYFRDAWNFATTGLSLFFSKPKTFKFVLDPRNIMSDNIVQIEKLLLQLDSKSLEQLQAYLEYLVFLQKKDVNKTEGKSRYELMQRFKGDAPFPGVNVSKYDVYAQ